MNDFSRRRFVLGTAAVAATGALAGCSGNGDGNGNGNGMDDENGDEEPETLEGRAMQFLEDNEARGWDGSIADEHGQEEVTVDVGAGDNGFAFDPAGVAVDVGTTVVFEWTGRGGGHNVVSEPGSDFEVESERTDEEGFTFEFEADEEGVLLYVCTPHRAQGKYGAVVVE